ncbi:MAG: TetR/AcrR family transcriptional regulator [Solirubrobacteraceae bacterium]
MPATRKRRSTAEVRQLVLDSAQALFAQRGYDGATTREIARQAGVTEQVLFNQFESKAGLYAATVLEPFAQFAQEHIDAWQSVPVGELEPHEMLASYIGDLYEFTVSHRGLFQALGEQRFGAPVELILERLDAVGAEMAELHGFEFDVPVGVRLVFSATTSLALHQDSMLPGHRTEAVVNELKRALVAGLLRPPLAAP